MADGIKGSYDRGPSKTTRAGRFDEDIQGRAQTKPTGRNRGQAKEEYGSSANMLASKSRLPLSQELSALPGSYPVEALQALSSAVANTEGSEPISFWDRGTGGASPKEAASFGMYYPEEWNAGGIQGMVQRNQNGGQPVGFALTDELVNDLEMAHDVYDGESGRSLYDIALSNSRSLFGLPADIDRERLLYEQIMNAEPGETASWAGVPLTPFSAQKNDLPYRIRQNVGLSNGTLPEGETSIPVLLDNNRIANLADEKTRQTFAQQGQNGRQKGSVDWREPRPWPKVY